MKTFNTATVRRVGLVVALLAGSAVASPAFAACNAGSFHPNPTGQNNVFSEFNASAGYARVLVTLGINKSLAADNATAVWTQTGGPVVTLNTSNPQNPTFLTPDVSGAGATLTFRLTVTCPGGASASDTGTVSIIDVNRPPVAFAQAAPPIVYEGDPVTLTSTGTNDPDNDTLVYAWTRIAGPAVTLANASTPTASFIAPATGADYTAQFQLLVRDRATGGLTSTANVVVNVTHNLPPLAKLSCPAQVDEHGHVVLDGSASADPDGGPLTYQWTQLQGSPAISVGNESDSIVRFDAPALTTGQDGFVEFQLKATDSTGLWDLATCMLQIVDITPPTISVPVDIDVEADSAAGKTVSYSVYAQDAVDDAAPYLLACAPPSASVFPLGPAPAKENTTVVACSAHDSAARPGFPTGNVANASFRITVRDTTPPVISVPGALGLEATSAAGAVATFSATTADAVDGPGSAVCVPATGSTFVLGSTLVTCNASDARNNAATAASFNVTVHDTTAPVVTPPADVVAEATGPFTSVAFDTATATDAVGVVSISSDAPATFPVAVTTLHWTATDAAKNVGHAESLVTVQDTVGPTIEGHDPITDVEATTAAGAVVHYDAPATYDLVDGAGLATCEPVSGSTFALDTTTVTCDASDAHHNPAKSITFDVTVVDTTAPAIDAHDPVTAEATSADGATVTYTSPGTLDLVDGPGTASCTPASGTTFALGKVSVQCTATDAHDNTSHSSFDVTVVDTTPPNIDTHAAITKVEATGPSGAVVDYDTPLTHDLVDGDGVASCLPASGATFPLGTTQVLCDASDKAGNPSPQTSFTVQVVDTTAPVIATHGDVDPIEATSAAGAIATYVVPTWTDAVDVSGNASCSPLSGTQFKLGQTTVACAAVDHAGNAATVTYFKVTVRDHTAPVIATHGNQSAEATSAAGAAVTYTSPATSDAVDGPGSASCLPVSGSTFPLGSTTVTCSAHDAADNASTPTTFSITVVDTTAPAIAPHADVNATATGNSSAVVTYTLPIATDLVDGNVTVSCLPASGASFTVGTTAVNCNSTDHAGNRSASNFNVIVSYGFSGFYRPVDNLPTMNVVKAGSAIPVKFSLGGDQGLNIFASGYPASVTTGCSAPATDAIEETVTAGGSSLSYDAGSGQYIYVWKTEKSWTGCRQLQVKLRDGSSRWAVFSFTR